MTKDRKSMQIMHALQVAKERKRDELRKILQATELRSTSDATIDEIWLTAELMYINGDYKKTIEFFERFENHPRSSAASSWQRYISAHRRTFASLQSNQILKAQTALEQAEELLWESANLASRYGDLSAMRAHLQELRGDFESAKASFTVAHNAAIERGDVYRGATTASDLGRIHGILGSHAEGLDWLARAEKLIDQSPNEHVRLTIQLRRSIIYIALGMHKESLNVLNNLIPRAQKVKVWGVLAHSLTKRADVLRLESSFDEAESDLISAIDASQRADLPNHELYCHKDLAILYVERGNVHDDMHAVRQFDEALSTVPQEFVPSQ